jgi:PA14 domain
MARFGTTVVVPGGLRGDVYYIPPGTAKLPEFHWFKPVGSIYTSSLNVPPQSFLQGFPGVTDRFEWFAIDYSGRFWIENPGVYRFALTSDDGSKLYIDDEPASVKLSGGIHRIRVSYFQGPRDQVALVLQVAGPGDTWRIFSTDEFKPPPDPDTWSYPDAEHNAHLRVSSATGAPGDQVSVEVAMESPLGRDVVHLRWEAVVPSQLLEVMGGGPDNGIAATESGKLLSCSKQKSYMYVCTLAGGQKPIVNGPIAVFHFRIRADAQPRTAVIRIENVEAVMSNQRQFTLGDAEGTVSIHAPNPPLPLQRFVAR